MAQHHPQAWPWKPPMESHHHLYPEEAQYEREHMFEKPLTPSDVGKLNRLVIPKQHAEKYFPLDGCSGERGLLLSFEDESGKTWRFRYSYWSSSQSYVLTKGWSRFVKEKKIDAGDVVLFERPRFGGHQHFFIGCRRRGASASRAMALPTAAAAAACSRHDHGLLNEGDRRDEPVQKRFRLFGVNFECRPEPEPHAIYDLHLMVLRPESMPVHDNKCIHISTLGSKVEAGRKSEAMLTNTNNLSSA